MSHRRVKAVSSAHDSSHVQTDDYSDEEDDELTPELREQLTHAARLVESQLADELTPEELISLPENAIHDAVWYYYGDVEKSVQYLSKTYAKKAEQSSAKKTPKKKVSLTTTCESYHGIPFSIVDFFTDSPWLNIPTHRRGEILIEPLYPRGGLLGGNPEAAGGKMSKLAALAAARKQKAQAAEGTAVTGDTSNASGEEVKKDVPRRYPRKDKPAEESTSTPVPDAPQPVIEKPIETVKPLWKAEDLLEKPSSFASTAFDQPVERNEPTQPSVHLSYTTQPNFAKWVHNLGPSPDDKVITAQSGMSKGTKSTKKVNEPKPVDNVDKMSSSVASLSVQEPKAAFKNIDVLAEYAKMETKKSLSFVVIGHVDAGKSTLMGRLLYDLGEVDERTLERLRKEATSIGKASFALAWVMDQSTEERNRGVTIDYATNKFETEKAKFTILDAPGHRDFIPNMIAGASMADFALLVIDSSTGEFESGFDRGGQTKEHALLVRSMGVQRIVVAVNKLDTVAWSRERFQEIETQLTAFLTTAGLQQKNLSFVPCSGLTGDNIVHKAKQAEAGWYKGPSLVELLEKSTPLSRAVDKPLRMTIDNIFRGSVQNPLSVSGRIGSGCLQVGEALVTMPMGETTYIKGIEVDNESRDWAVAGQSVVLHLTDIEQSHLRGGDVLCHQEDAIKNSKTFTMKILAFSHLTPMFVDILHGRLYSAGRIKSLVAALDKSTGNVFKKRPKIIQPGGVARVIVEANEALPVEAAMRVVLRAQGETVGAGLIESTAE